MAYRFLLEVPETLAAEASVAVDRTPDAQVILVRDSHGLGFEDEFVDLTVAAHTLRVIDSLYDWFDRLGASRPDIRLVLHSGERVTLEGVDRGAMVAAIRRDQPWVERSIPKVGEHEPSYAGSPATEPGAPLGTAIDAAGSNAPDAAIDLHSDAGPVPATEMTRRVTMRGINYIAVNVNDLPKAERFYEEFLNLHLEGRARVGADGAYQELAPDFDWEAAVRDERPADVSYLRNGPVALVLRRVGRGARLDRGVVDHISVAVDPATFTTLKGEALVRPLTVIANTADSFQFRDPYGLVWEITAAASAMLPGARA